MPAIGIRLILVGCLVAHALWVALQPVAASDLWVALAAGRWIVDHRTIPLVDVFSYTVPGAPWFNQEWLAQVIFFELYQADGGTTLALFKVAVVLVTFGLAAWLATRRSGSLALGVACAALAAFVCRPFLDLRAQMFTFPAALIVLGALDAYRQRPSWIVAVLVPLTIAVWVNLHYGFIYGVAMCFLFAAAEALRRPSRAVVPLGVIALSALVAALLNPQGLHALTFPFAVLDETSASRAIIEWQAPVLFGSGPYSPLVFTYYLLAQIGVALAVVVWRRRAIDLQETILVMVTAAMALSARRFIPLFALMGTPFLARNVALIADRWENARRRDIIVSLVGLAATLHIGWRITTDVRQSYAAGFFDGMTRESSYFPRNAIEFLKLNSLPGRLFNLYTWAGYVLFRLPERQVFIDPRAHAVYPGEISEQSLTVEMGRPGWEAVLEKQQVALILWPSTVFADEGFKLLLDQLKTSTTWFPVYDDGHAALFAHIERGKEWLSAYRTLSLRYPDVPDAQLFAGEAILRAGEFGRARDHFLVAIVRHPELEKFFREILVVRLDDQAKASNDPAVWFQLGFAHDVLGDAVQAAANYQTALAMGINEPMLSFASSALARMAGSR